MREQNAIDRIQSEGAPLLSPINATYWKNVEHPMYNNLRFHRVARRECKLNDVGYVIFNFRLLIFYTFQTNTFLTMSDNT